MPDLQEPFFGPFPNTSAIQTDININSQIHGHGYGGQIIMEGTEEIDFKHMVICKNEVNNKK